MGQEIQQARFSDEAFAEFAARLRQETDLLVAWERDGCMRDSPARLGYELEAWLVDQAAAPAPRNAEFIKQVDDPLIVPELARFNFEINDHPLDLGAGQFLRMQEALQARWQRCAESAAALGLQPVSVGILPTLQQHDLCLGNISELSRYHALNEQVFQLRGERPLEIAIHGEDALALQHHDVMLEAATTSLQVHLQLPSTQMVRAFNAAKMLSAPLVALAANSPLFLGKRLWMESRIPLFEQAVAVGCSDYSKRVTFGVRYAHDSISECFIANRDRYPILLPDLMDKPPEALAHLRLHNGTIWRWNRPLIDFDAQGVPAYRLEHRVMSAGTSAIDMVAQTALFVGLVQAFLQQTPDWEQRLPFAYAQRNFYQAAQLGLDAQVQWLDGREVPLDQLLSEVLLPLAAEGLAHFGLDAAESRYWLDVIAQRVASRQTGAAWQLAWVRRYGSDWAGLVQAYIANQTTGQPVHAWSV